MRDCFNSFPKDYCVYLCWEALPSAIAGHTARTWENNCKYHFKFTTQITVQAISMHFQKFATIIEATSKSYIYIFFFLHLLTRTHFMSWRITTVHQFYQTSAESIIWIQFWTNYVKSDEQLLPEINIKYNTQNITISYNKYSRIHLKSSDITLYSSLCLCSLMLQ